MFRRRKVRPEVSPELRDALVQFGRTLVLVEGAKERLAAAAPSGRGAGLPLAEALGSFEQGLRQAELSMPGWRRPELEGQWSVCRDGLREALRRAELLRLGDAPEGYERLYGELGDLMEPLEAFDSALALVARVAP